SAAEDLSEKIVSQFPRGLRVTQLAPEERGDWFVVGIAQFSERPPSFGRIRLRAADLRPSRGAKVRAGSIPPKGGWRGPCWVSGHWNPSTSSHRFLTRWREKVTSFRVP